MSVCKKSQALQIMSSNGDQIYGQYSIEIKNQNKYIENIISLIYDAQKLIKEAQSLYIIAQDEINTYILDIKNNDMNDDRAQIINSVNIQFCVLGDRYVTNINMYREIGIKCETFIRSFISYDNKMNNTMNQDITSLQICENDIKITIIKVSIAINWIKEHLFKIQNPNVIDSLV